MNRFWQEPKKSVVLIVAVASAMLVGASDIVVYGTPAPGP